jgi:glycine oxidase
MRILDERARDADVFVVGAGIVGLAIAAELLDRGLRVTVVEQGRAGHGASGAAGGMLAPVSEAEDEPAAVVELGLDSLARWPAWADRLETLSGMSCEYRSEGTLHVALRPDDRTELDRLARALGDRGLAATRITGSRARELEPHVSPRVTAGLEVAGDHQVDPRRACACLASAVGGARGGRLVEGAGVERVEVAGGRVIGLRLRDAGAIQDIAAATVVVAAGVDTCRTMGLPFEIAGLRPVKGQLVRLRGRPILTRVVRSRDVYLIPRRDGELLVGATMEEAGYDLGATAGGVLDLLRHAREILPAVHDLAFAEVSVGLRSVVRDQRPVIGPTGVDGLYLAVGHFRNGVLLAPATAFHLAEAIVGRRVPAALEPFLLSRLSARVDERRAESGP